MIEKMAERYGQPKKVSFEIPITDTEFKRIKSSQKNDRNHDVTLYIIKEGKIVIIAKPFYPPKLYRAPSGGLNPGESFDDGIAREAHEETGCEIELQKFLLRTSVNFFCDRDCLKWRSFVFQAKYIAGDFNFTDTHEIREVRLAKLEEFELFSTIMRDSSIGGLHYRAALHDTVKPLLEL